MTLADGSRWRWAICPWPTRCRTFSPEPPSRRIRRQAIRGVAAAWKRTHASRSLDANRVEHTIVYADPQTGLEVRWVAIAYTTFPP